MHRGIVRILTAGSVQMLRDLLGWQCCAVHTRFRLGEARLPGYVGYVFYLYA